jgi:major vault protein
MNERGSRKIPVTERQFLWVQDDDKGEVTLHVGPTMVSPTAADRVVIDDGDGGFREDISSRPQRLIEVGDHQYAVLYNPLLENDGGANGRFRVGRNETRPLKNGTRAMIPGPCSFYLRPGQRAEVRDAHELSASQYLVVKVYGPLDSTAPYHEVTVRSAAITRATAEALDGRPQALPDAAVSKPLMRGQLIVVRGIDTQFYIPPSGVDIVPDTSVDESGATLSAVTAQRLVAQMQQQLGGASAPKGPPPPPPPAEPMYQLDDSEESEQERSKAKRAVAQYQSQAAFVDQAARTRQRVPSPAKVPSPAPAMPAPAAVASARAEAAVPPPATSGGPPVPPPASIDDLLASDSARKAIEREARQARLVRHAAVLGEKEFCVLIDPDGKREIKVGPARVFPGPYDTFMTKGSRNRTYDAYELLPQRALWLRVICQISRDDMAAKMPRGVQLDKEMYYPGDEILLSGVSGFFFPFNEIEVLSPQTGEAVVGNDHSGVFIEAIGIDQKSGIYVRDLTTGEVRLIRGKQSYLVDPRKEIHITRTLSIAEWNLWIAPAEPHKLTNKSMVTPWAVSIIVPHNTAVLATSAAAQRVIEGPCVTLLEYEETLVPLGLSTGTPKSDDHPLQTCFLRTVGNRVGDIIEVETSDFVRIHIRTSYSVTFNRDHRDKWFNCENYIQVMSRRTLISDGDLARSTQLDPPIDPLTCFSGVLAGLGLDGTSTAAALGC